MSAKPVLSSDELVYLSHLFDADRGRSAAARAPAGTRRITCTTELPAMVPASLFGKSRLTLQADLGDYRLAFPVHVTLDEFDQLSSTVGVPEVIDTGGQERSWRLTGDDDVALSGDEFAGKISVDSISSTGVSLRLSCARTAERLLAQDRLRLRLPDGQVVITRLEPIRREHGLLAARIRPCSASRHALNRFLFQKHRANHPELYQGVRLPTAGRDN